MIGLVQRMQRLSRMLLVTRKGSGGVGAGRAGGGTIGRSSLTGVGWGTGGGGMGVWSVRVRHVLWLLLLWMVCGVHLLYLFASHGVQDQSEPQQIERRSGGIGVESAGVVVGFTDSSPGGKVAQSSIGFRGVQLSEGNIWFRGQQGINPDQNKRKGQTVLSFHPDRGSHPAKRRGTLENHEKSVIQEGGHHFGGQQMRKLADIDSYTKTLPNSIPSWGKLRTSEQDSSTYVPAIVKGHHEGKGGRGRDVIYPRVKHPRTMVDGNNVSDTDHFNPPVSKQAHLDLRSSATTPRSYAWIACTSMSPPVARGTLEKPLWQAVRRGQSYVFSAYHDPRELVVGRKAQHGVIRVIGITDTRVDGAPQFCQLWYRRQDPQAQGHQQEEARRRAGRIHYSRGGVHHSERQRAVNDTQGARQGGLDLVVVPAISDIIPETHGLRFAPFIYTCRLTSVIVPLGVSLTHTRCEPPLNFLPIHPAHHPSRDKNSDHATNYTVCVTPFNMKYNNAQQLVEKIEIDRTFGANNFVFYNFSSGPALAKYLESYEREGIARVVPWDLPLKVDTWPPNSREVDIHYFGQLAALNDCLYRNMFTSKMVIFTDMDEMIVPKKHGTWRELVKFLIYKGQGSAGTFIFQNAFFRTEWPDDKSFVNARTSPADSSSINVISLLKTKREKYIYPWGLRSKYICDPSKVEMVGVHNVWRFVNDSFTELDVPSDIGLLHHYRSWNRPEETNSVIDRSLHRYKDTITFRIKQRHRSVQQKSIQKAGYAL